MSETSPAEFPALLEVEYPDHELDWLTTFLRPFMVIPIAIVLGLLSGPAAHAGAKDFSLAAGGIVWLPTVLMLTFRRKYPRWWFDWNLELTRFSTRVASYLALLTDKYPSTDEEQDVYIAIAYPDAAELNRWLPLSSWLPGAVTKCSSSFWRGKGQAKIPKCARACNVSTISQHANHAQAIFAGGQGPNRNEVSHRWGTDGHR